MTTILNHIDIDATPQQVWDVLADLDALADYDPFVETSTLIGDQHEGVGAQRKCTVKPMNWFQEQVTIWEPVERLQYTIIDCNLPTRDLTHSYTITAYGATTRVEQVMNYEMRGGPAGRLLDRLVVRRKSDKQIKGFFVGLKEHVEQQST